MEKANIGNERIISYMIYGALMVLALGLVTSTTILALFHILMIVPIIYFLPKADYKHFPKSTWALIAMVVAMILSTVMNQDIAINGYKPIGKMKYFLFGFLTIAPFAYYFKNFCNEKKIGYLFYVFCVATTVAGIAGIVGMNTGYNYISMRTVNLDRNAGLSGMVLNYAHNLAYFQIIILGLIIYRKEIGKIINTRFLYFVFVMNSIALYLSYTRGAILALVVGIPFFIFKNNKFKFLIIALITILITAGAYFISGNNILRPGSDNERISQWQAAIKAFEERPVFGYGYLNFEQYSVPIKKRYNLGQLQFGGHAHNNFLEMLASTGIIGFICYVGWLGLWFIEIYKRNDVVAKITLPFIVVFIVGGLTQSTISLGVNLFFIMAIYAISQAAHKKQEVLKL
jgi:O-antigen ligase